MGFILALAIFVACLGCFTFWLMIGFVVKGWAGFTIGNDLLGMTLWPIILIVEIHYRKHPEEKPEELKYYENFKHSTW